jgi:hypothetical protein
VCAAKAWHRYTPGSAEVRRGRQRGNPGSIEARFRDRVGIGDAATMGGIMDPHAAREGSAAGNDPIVAGVDGNLVMPPIDPAPAP